MRLVQFLYHRQQTRRYPAALNAELCNPEVMFIAETRRIEN